MANLACREVSGVHSVVTYSHKHAQLAPAPWHCFLPQQAVCPLQRQSPLHMQEQHYLRQQPQGRVLDRGHAQCS